MENSGLDMYVFRDGRKTFAGRELLHRLADALVRLRRNADRDSELRALIAAGRMVSLGKGGRTYNRSRGPSAR
jgi:hypothetical protein